MDWSPATPLAALKLPVHPDEACVEERHSPGRARAVDSLQFAVFAEKMAEIARTDRVVPGFVLVMVMLLTGCGPATPAVDATGSPAPTGVAEGTPPAPTANQQPTADAVDIEFELGQRIDVVELDGTVWADATVFAYRQPVAQDATRPSQHGFEWGAADVRVCAKRNAPEQLSVSHSPWGLSYADDTLIEPSNIGYRQFPEPSYPFGDRALARGRCLRGWVTFGVPEDKRPIFVEYAPPSIPVPLRWTVPL